MLLLSLLLNNAATTVPSNTFALAAAAAAAAALFAVQFNARLPMEGAADLMQLALNCSNTTAAATAVHHLRSTAACAARRMPKLLDQPWLAGCWSQQQLGGT
jgi:hypothetical protein